MWPHMLCEVAWLHVVRSAGRPGMELLSAEVSRIVFRAMCHLFCQVYSEMTSDGAHQWRIRDCSQLDKLDKLDKPCKLYFLNYLLKKHL